MSLRTRRGQLVLGGVLVAIAVLVVVLVAAGDDGGDTDADGGEAAALSGDAPADAEAKADLRNAQVAIEVYATDHNGDYSGATTEELRMIEPTVPDDVEVVEAAPTSYELSIESESGTEFRVDRDPNALVTRDCDPPNQGGCDPTGGW